VQQQQEQLAALCRIRGTLSAPQEPANPLVVVLIRHDGAASEIVDHYVLERPGAWYFVVTPGTYSLGAFSDRNDDLRYEPGEPVVISAQQLELGAGARVDAGGLTISSDARRDLPGEIDLSTLHVRSNHDQTTASLGLVSAVGDVADLSDPRFDFSHGDEGMLKPFDFILNSRPGVYFLQQYDAGKVPVLFVHGYTGTPRDFEPLIARLDRSRFQPWVYFYPTGADIDAVAEHLSGLISKLRLRYRFDRLHVVGYSMGGLVSRAFIQKHHESTGRSEIGVFVSISTPWSGDDLAAKAVKRLPVVVHSWKDLAADSPFLTGLFYADSKGVQIRRSVQGYVAYYLVFTYRRNSLKPGVSDDREVTVASELRSEAQEEAKRMFGFDETHFTVLSNPQLAATLNELFTQSGNGGR
jgi:pimeloyl-ACP methyl ester carboxylesterase